MGTSAQLVGALRRSLNVLAHPHRRDGVERGRLGKEQTALRRVATLVARSAPPAEVFEAVVAEVGRLLPADAAALSRYETDGTLTLIGGWRKTRGYASIGTRHSLETSPLSRLIVETGRPGRVDSHAGVSGSLGNLAREVGWRSSVGAPVIVEGRLWGVVSVASTTDRALPVDTEERVAEFTELLATAIANAESREELKRLAEEQAALRRVATLVAEGAAPGSLLAVVAREVAGFVNVPLVSIVCYEADGTATERASVSERGELFPVGSRWLLDGTNVVAQVRESGRAARINDYSGLEGTIADTVRRAGIRSTVGIPIVVDGELWGAMVVSSTEPEPLPEATEARLADFTELVGTAIANAESRAELIASRARVVAAADDARRRVVRDLHDGAQQRLVHTVITLKLAQRELVDGQGTAQAQVAEALDQAEQANAELRELAHGILPSVLTRGGLRAGVDALVSRIDVPVEVEVSVDRLPIEIEASAYFVVAEALTNVVKHSRAGSAEVKAWVDDGALHLEIRDDGAGGAQPDGVGLLGLADRLAALEGRLRVESPQNAGTVIAATLPLPV
jgi:signal transduction histidine kinase